MTIADGRTGRCSANPPATRREPLPSTQASPSIFLHLERLDILTETHRFRMKFDSFRDVLNR